MFNQLVPVPTTLPKFHFFLLYVPIVVDPRLFTPNPDLKKLEFISDQTQNQAM